MKKLMVSNSLMGMVLVLGLLMTVGNGWAATAIKLGAHAPQSGSLAKHGIEQMKGILLAVEVFEKKRNIKVELFKYDDESNPQRAISAVEKLAGLDKVDAIVGGYGSNLVGPASEAAERYNVPYMTTGAVDSKLTAKKFKNFFRLNNMPGYARAQTGLVKELLAAKKVGVIYNSLSATTEIAGAVKDQLLEAGIAVPVFEKFEKGTTNYKPILLKIKDSGCEVMIVEGYFQDYLDTIKDAKTLNLPIKAYIGAWGIGTPEFVRELGPMSEYVYGTSIWEMGTAPKEAKKEEAEIVASYKEKYKEKPSYIAMLGYLSGQYMLEAIAKGGDNAGKYSPEKTRNVLRGMDVVGPLGRVAFDDKGDPRYFTAVLFQTQKGNQVVVYPKDRAQGAIQYPGVPWGKK